PHARVRSIDAREALAMPGVKAILTGDDMPKPADAMTDLGQRIPANPLGERGLTNEPVYQGEPILAVCAVDELTCAGAIEKTRTAMAYWQNGKEFVHCSTQSTAQTAPAVARWLGLLDDKGQPDLSSVVIISEYTGGGFGSKITSAIYAIIPAMLSKKVGAPVMMRVSREEEHYIGKARPSIHGRLKVGFTKDGRITAVDMFVICDSGPYDPQGD